MDGVKFNFEGFIDYQNAFYKVLHAMMLDSLKQLAIDDKDLRIITNCIGVIRLVSEWKKNTQNTMKYNADSMEGLQEQTSARKSYGLDMNIRKTKHMVILKNSIQPRTQLTLNQKQIEVSSYIMYLGTTVNDQLGSFSRD